MNPSPKEQSELRKIITKIRIDEQHAIMEAMPYVKSKLRKPLEGKRFSDIEATTQILQTIVSRLPEERPTKFSGEVQGMYYIESWDDTSLDKAKFNTGYNQAIKDMKRLLG